MRYAFREAYKRLRLEEREDALASSTFLATINQLQAFLMQKVATDVSTAITAMQSQI